MALSNYTNGFDEAMRQALQQPRYDVLTGRAMDIRKRIMDAVSQAILRLLERLDFTLPDGPGYDLAMITRVFLAAGVVLLLAVIAGAIFFILRRRGRREQAESIGDLFDEIAQNRFSAAELLSRSRAFAEAGQMREAVRMRYIAVLVVLNERNIIRVDKSKTNAQLADELHTASPGLSHDFFNLADIFQYAWFGRKAVDDGLYASYERYADALLGGGYEK